MDKNEIESRQPVVFIHNIYSSNNQQFLTPYGKDVLSFDNCITFVLPSIILIIPNYETLIRETTSK